VIGGGGDVELQVEGSDLGLDEFFHIHLHDITPFVSFSDFNFPSYALQAK
jgi:hypothetical protein